MSSSVSHRSACCAKLLTASAVRPASASMSATTPKPTWSVPTPLAWTPCSSSPASPPPPKSAPSRPSTCCPPWPVCELFCRRPSSRDARRQAPLPPRATLTHYHAVRRVSTLLLLVLVLAGLPGAVPVAASETDSPERFFGAVQAIYNPERAAQAGVQWERLIFPWSLIQKDGPNQWADGYFSDQ